jgi:UDP-glucose 4-epimerase
VETPSRFNRNSSRRVLVTGGSGALGRHVISLLICEGWDVTALIHRNAVPVSAGPGRLRVVSGNLGDPTSVLSALSEVDAVCHLAAYLPPDYGSPAYASACFEINALATLQLGRLCGDRGKRFVFCSSGQAYAHSSVPVAEDAPLYPAERATFYLASKLSGELFVEHLRRHHGLEAITFRIGSCYGPGMPRNSVVAFFMAQAIAREPLTVRDGGVPSCDFVYVGDVARLVTAALKTGAGGVYNAGSGIATSVLELAHAVKETFSETPISIDVAPAGRRPAPASFPALSMAKTQGMWGRPPTSLKAGLAAFRTHLEQEI